VWSLYNAPSRVLRHAVALYSFAKLAYFDNVATIFIVGTAVMLVDPLTWPILSSINLFLRIIYRARDYNVSGNLLLQSAG